MAFLGHHRQHVISTHFQHLQVPCYVTLTITQWWYSVIIFPFTETEAQFVPERIPIPHLSIFGIFTNNLFCFTFTCLNAWMRFEYLCTSIEQICLVFDWQANCQGSARGFLGEFNNFELSPKKRKIEKEHIYKQSRMCFQGKLYLTEVTPLR